MSTQDELEGRDVQLMADGCVGLLKIIFGDDNWQRWSEIKHHTQLADLQTFVTWLLDIAEQDISYNKGYGASTPGPSVNIPPPAPRMPSPRVLAASQMPYHTSQLDDDVVVMEDHRINYDPSKVVEAVEFESDACGVVAAGGSVVEIVSGAEEASGGSHFYCQVCSVSLGDVQVVDEHMRLRHAGHLLRLSCACCAQTFSAIEGYVSYHKQTAALKHPSKTFVCDYCAKALKTRQLLEEHVSNKHLKTGPRHECDACQKRFSYACNLNKHRKKCPATVTPAITL